MFTERNLLKAVAIITVLQNFEKLKGFDRDYSVKIKLVISNSVGKEED